VFASAFAEWLDDDHQEALHTAMNMLVDEFYQDVADLLSDPNYRFDQTNMDYYLPRMYRARYTPLFAKRFLTCLLTVIWKLNQRELLALSSVAEELAAHALIERATGLLEGDGIPADFGGLKDAIRSFSSAWG
jgi:hypothetical protein